MFMLLRLLAVLIVLAVGFPEAAALAQPDEQLPPPLDRQVSFPSFLFVTPKEIELGSLRPGEGSQETFYMRNLGSGGRFWTIEGPEGWIMTGDQKISGVVSETPEKVKMHLTYLKEVGQGRDRNCLIVLNLEAGDQTAAYRTELPAGELRETITIISNDQMEKISFHATLEEQLLIPLLHVDPVRMDFGTVRPGGLLTKRILLTNRGREPLNWKAGIAGSRGMSAANSQIGRYVSFRGDSSAADSYYFSGAQTRENLELIGAWTQEDGYPSMQGEQSRLRYRYTGTGIVLYFWKSSEGGSISIYLDERLVDIIDCHAAKREISEVLIKDDEPIGPHLLAIVNGEGKVTMEGVRIYGGLVPRGPRGWISVFPDSGTTTRETDYINVSLDTRNLLPGVYGEQVKFTSNGGEAYVDVFLDVAAETQHRYMDVYRYMLGSDYLYTANPQAEMTRLKMKGYRNTGIVFRLFAPGAPGTTDFFRWFNPERGDHFYSYDPKGGKPLQGYIFEGSIGNIGTSRLTGTKELYRWYNPTTKHHFYTTDQGGEGITKKGYRYDGIAGFVR